MAGTADLMGGGAGGPAAGTQGPAPAPPNAAALPSTGDPFGAAELFGAGSAGATGDAGGAAANPRVDFGLGGEPDFTPDGVLNAGELAAFCSHGWTCPELQDLGYHLIWARAGVLSGEEVLELRLTDGRHFAAVLEQHVSLQTPGPPSAPARAGGSPVNVLTGHTAVADGFTLAGTGTPSPGAEPGNGALWTNPAPPFRAIYQTAGATYTYISDLPAEQADDGAIALTRASSDAPEPAAHNGIPQRIERGLSRILEHLAP